jgi:hypothetical protein
MSMRGGVSGFLQRSMRLPLEAEQCASLPHFAVAAPDAATAADSLSH